MGGAQTRSVRIQLQVGLVNVELGRRSEFERISKLPLQKLLSGLVEQGLESVGHQIAWIAELHASCWVC